MTIILTVFSLFVVSPADWGADWAWGVPLIVVTVLIHVLGLGVIGKRVARAHESAIERRHTTSLFVMVMGATTLLVTILHALEATIWGVAYRLLGALPDNKSAMLYSLNAITSYGHTNLNLEEHWHLMGALEALNGWLLFGLTTAFLFGVLEKLRLLGNGGHR
jgi:hypothetical protein